MPLLLDKKPIRVAVIHGDPEKYNPILPGGYWDDDDFLTISRAKEALKELEPEFSFIFLCNHDTLLDDLRQRRDEIDLVLQLCDEGWFNHPKMEMHLTCYLEMLGLRYTGSGPKSISLTYDKQNVLEVAKSIGVPVPISVYVQDEVHLGRHGLDYPVIIKPNSTDGSFGITAKNVCNSLEELKEAYKIIRSQFGVSGPVLVQEYLSGPDINVGLIGNEPTVLPITEEDYSALPEDLPKICGFESKWDENSPYWLIKTKPTTLSKEKQEIIIKSSQNLFKRIEVRDYARFDWRLDRDGMPRLLEANPNCGWCWDGHLPKTAGLCGISYSGFFKVIMKSAIDRYNILDTEANIYKEKRNKVVAIDNDPSKPVPLNPISTSVYLFINNPEQHNSERNKNK